MDMNETKGKVAEVARRMAELDLVSGTNGNVSARLPNGLFAITPMGKRCGAMSKEDIVVVDGDLNSVEGNLAPSSESLLHLAIYRARPDVGGIVHTHAVYSSAVAVVGLEIPPIVDEMVLALGGPVRVSEYAPPASPELAKAVYESLGNHDATLIRNHGAVGVGATPEDALEASILTERVASIFVLSSILGSPSSVPDQVMASEAAIFEMQKTVRLKDGPALGSNLNSRSQAP